VVDEFFSWEQKAGFREPSPWKFHLEQHYEELAALSGAKGSS